MIPRQAQRLSLITALVLPALLLCALQAPLWGARDPSRAPERTVQPCAEADRGRGEVAGLVLLDGGGLPEAGVAPEGVRVLLRRDGQGRQHVRVEAREACHVVALPALDDPQERLVHVLLPASAQRRAAVALQASQATYTIDLTRPTLRVSPPSSAVPPGAVVLGESAVLASAGEWAIR